MAATVQAWLARSAASAPQVILTISERGPDSVDMPVILAESVARDDHQRFGGQAPWEARYGYCRVVRAGALGDHGRDDRDRSGRRAAPR